METTTTYPGRDGHVGDPVRLGIVAVSDRASRGEYVDEEDLPSLLFPGRHQESVDGHLSLRTGRTRCRGSSAHRTRRPRAMQRGRHHGRYRTCPEGHHARGHRGGVRSNDAGFWRTDAGHFAKVRAHRHPLEAGRRIGQSLIFNLLVVRNPFERPSMSCGKPFRIASI